VHSHHPFGVSERLKAVPLVHFAPVKSEPASTAPLLFEPPGGPSTSDSIEGVLGHIVFRNPESHFVIARLEVEGHLGNVTVKGLLPGVGTGERLRVQGQWVDDPRYGRQFDIESFLPLVPDTEEGLERFLRGGRVEGIGPVYAKRLVAFFGDKTLEVLDNAPDRLREVPGIGPSRASRIAKSWAQQRGERDAIIFLSGLGLAAGLATRVFRRYRDHTVRKVRENPYRMAADIPGIGFLTADEVAGRLGIEKSSPHRLRAGLLHTLSTATSQGHCFLPLAQLVDHAAHLLRLDELEGAAPDLQAPLTDLVAERVVVRETVGSEQRLWLSELHADEVDASERLAALAAVPMVGPRIDVERAIDWAQGRSALQFSDEQRRALQSALSHKVVVVTGGPGTGKTTLLRALLQIWEGKRLRVRLAAPTGRAARRMEEATGQKASTLHRLLEFSPQEGGFLRNTERPIPADVLVVDESSMVDLPLFAHLLRGLPPQLRLVLVGDVQQLPSVGPGRVLADLIHSNSVHVVRLQHVFRQDDAGLIVTNAHRILAGQRPHSADAPDGDYFFIARDNPDSVVRTVVRLVTERIARRWNLDPRDDIQVLVPMRKGPCGVEALNQALRDAIQGLPEGGEGSDGVNSPASFRLLEGDRVMQTRNNYDKQVFNGDVGRVVEVRGDATLVGFGDQEVLYEGLERDQLQLAYATTIHKSQGSEYPAVVIPLVTQHYRMLKRNLLYTAITRGRQVVVVVGSERAVEIAVGNADAGTRYTSLAERLALI